MKKSTAMVVNPRRKRRRRRNPSSVMRNPVGGVVAAAKEVAPTMAGGVVGGIVSGFVDTKLLSDKPLIAVLSKVAMALLGAAALRKHPRLAAGFAGGTMGALGYSVGVKLGGGMVAMTHADAVKGLGSMSEDNQALADVVDASGLGDVVDSLQGGDSGDGMGDDMGDEAAPN